MVQASDKDIARDLVNKRPVDRLADVFFDAKECKHGKYLPPDCDEWMEFVVVDDSKLCQICCSSYPYGKLTKVWKRSDKEIKQREIDML